MGKAREMLSTKRLFLREMSQCDFSSLCGILQDEEVMYAYEHAFSDEEVQEWLDKQLCNYERFGFGLWAVILKENNKMIGQCGLTMQNCNGRQELEIGYLLNKAYWHKGYALEASIACKEYAFSVLNAKSVCSIIRDTNIPSQRVAIRNGMKLTERFTKHYYNMDMPHLVFSIAREDVQ